PACMVDLATLTGAIIIALAHEHAGVFSMTDEIADMLISSGESVNEGVWRMPLTKTHLEMIKSDIADMKNMGPGRAGGSSTAAAYLKRFVDDKMPWAHLDIAGTAWAYKDTPTCPKGGSGYGVRLLDQFVRDNYEGDA
ncbi:MAG: leucyl aminopeptidase, partial [Parvularculaceae bacterium]